MKSKDFLSDEILKQFKTGSELNDFLKQVQKRGIEKMLEGELDDHLGYEKHEKAPSQNSRNGYGQKKVRTSLGDVIISNIDIPRSSENIFLTPIIDTSLLWDELLEDDYFIKLEREITTIHFKLNGMILISLLMLIKT